MSYSTVKLCSGGGGFEAVPRPRQPIDLATARQRLERDGISVTDARVMLIFRLREEVTLARDGRILIKTRDAAAAESVFAELLGKLGLERTAP